MDKHLIDPDVTRCGRILYVKAIRDGCIHRGTVHFNPFETNVIFIDLKKLDGAARKDRPQDKPIRAAAAVLGAAMPLPGWHPDSDVVVRPCRPSINAPPIVHDPVLVADRHLDRIL